MAKKAAAHHGGAWKVAYADFVTAMMALFMVLWISSQDDTIVIATSQYFQNPFNATTEATSGVMPFKSNEASKSRSETQAGGGSRNSAKQIELTFLTSVAADFYRLLQVDQELEAKPVDIQVTSDGLRVTLFNRAKQPLFKGDTAEFTEWGDFVMQNLAWMIDRHRFRVAIDGHTRKDFVPQSEGYTGWSLSTAQSIEAQTKLEYYAVAQQLFERVTGYADTQPLPDEPAESEANHRITLSLTMTNGRVKESELTAPPATPVPTTDSPAP